MPASGLPKFFSVDSTAPTPPTLQLCIDAMSAELGGTELASPNGGPPLLTASPWSAHEEASLRAKLLAADYPEQDDTPGPAGLKFRNMSSVDVVITQVFPVGAKVTGSVKAGKDWGFANVVLGAKWRIETYAGGIRVPEYELTAPGSHHVFIVDFRRPLAVTEFENCFGTAASSLRSGEKVILKSPPNWVSAKNFLSGVHTNLKNDPIIDAILAHDPDAVRHPLSLPQPSLNEISLLHATLANTTLANTTLFVIARDTTRTRRTLCSSWQTMSTSYWRSSLRTNTRPRAPLRSTTPPRTRTFTRSRCRQTTPAFSTKARRAT